ncbi:NAD(P)-binding domain protein [Niveomyces insectorum RCEF 264]|uniref:NAD(P)-binding domain protein n=1 Tax=Niveomyces insectorum RCEF 264 TaxID=1081102 RepID=A0A167ZVZ3_9HYPO|nr:NAD(P)-binding domain protein [Niveomyces insectorum RCEF 264]
MASKTVVVMGCSASGVGAALETQGHGAFATARDSSKIPTALTDLPSVTTWLLDVASPASVASAVQMEVWMCWQRASRNRHDPGMLS